jgi:hypothetical protein
MTVPQSGIDPQKDLVELPKADLDPNRSRKQFQLMG